MKEVPHHTIEHTNLPWEVFITKEWSMKQVCNDLLWLKRQGGGGNEQLVQW